MSESEIIKAYNEGINSIINLVKSMYEKIEILSKEKATLEERVKTLENQINKNSQNSSKPPSTDGFKNPKPKSLREKTGKKVGGQEDHEGHTLDMVDNADIVIIHTVNECANCGKSIEDIPVEYEERRQVFDIPPANIEVTEHKAEVKKCSCCGHINKGKFPDGINQPVQYGSNIKATIVYFNQYQLVPMERTSQILSTLYNHNVSVGTIVNANNTCYEALGNVEKQIIENLKNAEVVNFDETGLSVKGKREWLHVASTEELTYYFQHEKRGTEAMDKMDILPGFKGTGVHDHWYSYFKYDCKHGLCNAHHLRELNGINECENQNWTEYMAKQLIEIKKAVEKRKEEGGVAFKPEEIIAFELAYDKVVEEGLKEEFETIGKVYEERQLNKKGRKKQSKSKNLLNRFINDKKAVLAFMYDFKVPFDNNLAERDVRMQKLRQKISGTFRSEQGVKTFCRIRGFVSTVKKRGGNIMESIKGAFEGNAVLPEANHS